jgi:quercetin dioxygenase-like cupin family protein
MTRRWLVTALFGGVSLAVVGLTVGQVNAKSSTPSSVTVKTLAQGPVKALPAGKIFVNILEFRQQPGSDFGPHAHQASIAYTLQGVDTISFPATAAQAVGPGQAAFIPALVVHTHQNVDGRIGAGAIAAGLIAVVLLLCAATWLRGGRRRVTIAVLSVVLIAGGALPLIGATANDYYLIAARPETQRTLPMPRPDGRVFYSSPDMQPVPAPPYVETLNAIAVPAGTTYDTPDAPGPEMIIVMDGTAAVHIGDLTTQLSAGGGAFAQAGQTVAIGNQGSGTLKLLAFAVTSAVPAKT